MRWPRIDWTAIAALPLLVITISVLVGLLWMAISLGAPGWALLGFILIGILVHLHRDKFSRTDSSGEMIHMPKLFNRAAEERARPGLPNWLYVPTPTEKSRIEFRDDPMLRRIVSTILLGGALACFVIAYVLSMG